MGERLTDDELRSAAATRPGYATYPTFRPGQPERLAGYWRGQPAASPAEPAPAPGWYTNVDIWGPEAPEAPEVPMAAPPLVPAPPPSRTASTAAAVGPAPVTGTAAPISLAMLPAAPVFDFTPRWIVERPWWRRRWHWAVMAADSGAHHGYAWTEAGARRRTARATRRAAR